MSRIVLSRHENGDEKFIVGFDLPMATYFWQEMGTGDEDGMQVRGAGCDMVNHFPTMQSFWDKLPAEVQELVTYDVQEKLRQDSSDPHTGGIYRDMSKGASK